MNPITFFVPGIPRPGGSKRAFPIRRRDGSVGVAVSEDCKHTREWRTDVREAFRAYAATRPDIAFPLDVPLAVTMVFVLHRPKSHYDKRGQIRERYIDARPERKPDVLKLARSTEDALTGLAWTDDARTTHLVLTKRYVQSGEPGAQITIEPLT